ncbi:PP2C family protein-serine/threonine phosphatase [Georgenia faecalis]|uniref:PP2C family protein-serine/threonine phosphatase n=1 Tax=Georgenia faecalis TaxID=2483799 RepID=A0ABV9DC94_9MICO|nr:SpoIIE family protein phosphatase [Georgenia faecalis]
MHDHAVRATPAPAAEALHILLVEDDDGDAFLVEELLAEADLRPDLTRAWSLEAALDALAVPVDCVLLDLGLPDASGLDALVRLREVSDAALVVLTGLDDAARGVQAVAAGAQDYLVKGTVDGELLGRAVRYAVERRRAEQERAVHEATRRRAEQTSRLERNLLAAPSLPQGDVHVTVRDRVGDAGVLGSDVYDAVQRPDGSVLALVGNVAGDGPDAAALGACLRIAWRALALADLAPEEVLQGLERVLRTERGQTGLAASAVVAALDGHHARVWLAAHPAPLVVGPDGVRPVSATNGPALGAGGDTWVPAELHLADGERLLLFSEGLTSARRDGGEPLGEDRLRQVLLQASGQAADDAGLADAVVRVAGRYGAPDDHLALLVLRPPA